MARFGLACPDCRHVFPRNITVGVTAAHMEAEHGREDVKFDLVVLCAKCNTITDLKQKFSNNKFLHVCPRCGKTEMVFFR